MGPAAPPLLALGVLSGAPPTYRHSGNFHQDTPSPLPLTARPRARFYHLNLTWTFKNSYLYGNQLILKEIEYFSSLWCENKMCRVGSPAKKVSLDCKEIKPVHPKGNQSWIVIGRLMLKLKLIAWPPDAQNWLLGKDPDAGKDWRQEQKGMTEDEMVGWHHRFNGHEFEQTLGVGDGQGDLACCDSWGHKESDTTEQLNWTESVLRRV